MPEPFTAELTIQPGDAVDGSAANGFAESVVTLRATSRGAPGSGVVDLRWGTDPLGTGISASTFLDDFWSGASVAHIDALAFGRMLLDRLLKHPNVLERWKKIELWRDKRPLRLELILPLAADSPISAVPFELLADKTSFLFYGARATLVRCLRDLEPRRATIHPHDRLLVAWANPIDIEPRVDDQVFQQHETSVAEAGNHADLDVPGAVARTDLARFQDALADQRPVPVVSLVAHGYAGGGRLAFENPDRTSQPVPASSIAAALQEAKTEVALLWSCHGARHHADLGSLAELLLQPDGGNLAAVLAAHGAVRASWTARATPRLLRALTDTGGSNLEHAVTHARQTLPENDPQWAALAYYARPSEGQSVTYERAAAVTIEALSAPEPAVSRSSQLIFSLGADRVEGIPSRPYYWVDRPVEIDEIATRLASGRLVTVRGMPGIGKTEVACEAADRVITKAAFPLEALWIALDDLRTVDDLRERIAAWIGVHDPDVPDWRLAKAIGARRAVWILDNAEDLIRVDGAGLRSFLDAILETCPGIKLLITSQRPLGNLHVEHEDTYVVHRIEDLDTCQRLFDKASGNTLGDRLHGEETRALLELLDGHPRSLVLVAGQIRDGGANLANTLARLRERGDEAVLAAELLESGTDWDDHDRLRAERLVSSLHLAYRPLLEHAPGAAELFAWLGALPAGLPVALASAIFGEDAPERIATLSRCSLVEFRGTDERLELPTPVRWYAERRLDADIPAERQAELLARTLEAIASLMTAAYDRLGKPGASASVDVSQREALNLAAMLGRVERNLPAAPDLARLVARAFSRWSKVRTFGGHNVRQVPLIERARNCVTALNENGKDYASLMEALGEVYLHTDRLAEAEAAYQLALAAFTAINERIGEANTRRALGDLYLRTARLADAETAYQLALAAFIAINQRLGEANSRLALGDLYLRTARLTGAEAAYQLALAAFTAIDNRFGEANTRLALGNTYRRTDRFTEAEKSYRTALADFTAIDNRFGKANTISALGNLAVARGRTAEGFEQFRSARAMLLAIDERLGAAGQLVYMARAARQALFIDRAIVLGGMAWQEVRAIDGRFNVMLAGSDLVESAIRGSNEPLARCAIILTWHHARAIEHPVPEQFVELVTKLIPPAKIEAGLDAADVEALERDLTTAIAEVAKRLVDAGEDPFSPLPSPPEEP
jgi:tetratricopeptide (TPR) repeat protein